jgi:hypothetical protein
MTFTSRLLIKRTAPGTRQTIEHEGHLCFVYLRKDGLGGVVVGDHEYPERVAYTVLASLMGEFEAAYGYVYVCVWLGHDWGRARSARPGTRTHTRPGTLARTLAQAHSHAHSH